jgi:cathepsin L/cathepsin H
MCGGSQEFVNYKSGVYSGPAGSNGSLRCNGSSINMAILIVGFCTEDTSGKQYWIVKNQMGTSWGLNGYIYVQRGLGLLRFPAYPNVA